MAFTEGGTEGALNGATAVDVVPAPAGATRRLLRNVSFYNADSAAVTITVSKNKTGTDYELAKEVLQPGDYWVYDKLVVLDATDEKVRAVMSAAAAGTNPKYDAAFADVS